MLRILLATCRNPHFATITEYVEDALRRQNGPVDFFDDRDYLLPGRLRDAVAFLQTAELRRLNRKLVQRALRTRPDVLLVMGGTRILPSTLMQARQAGIKTVLWTIDPSTQPIQLDPLLKTAPFYDLVFCGGTETMEAFAAHGFCQARWLPFGFSSGAHQRVEPTRAFNEDFDICFVGSYYPSRAKDLENLADFKLKIWGPGWEKLPNSSPLRSCVTPGQMSPDLWMKAYSAAKIVLCPHYHDGLSPCHQASPRVFEAMALGSFLMCDAQKDIQALFRDGEHLVIYKDGRDLREKAVYYLSHPEERRRIAANGRQAVLAGHSYDHRVRALLAAVGAARIPGRISSIVKRIKVLHIVEDLGMGGAEKVIFNLGCALDASRFDVRVWCLTKGGIMAQRLSQKGIEPEILAMGLRPSLGFVRMLAARLRAEGFDIVHTHGYTASTVARTAAFLARVPRLIAHAHTTVWHLGRKQLWTERLLGFFTERIICCSQAVADSLAERAGISRRKLSVVYNGTSAMPRSAPPGLRERLGIGADAPVILCVASLAPHKGHRILLEAFARVHGKFPQAVLILAGDGPCRRELEDLVGRLKLARQVIFTGIYQEVGELIGLCDLAVLASPQREGMSLWLAEAMSAGKPLAAFAIPSMTEVIVDGINGFLAPPGDPEELAAILERLLADPTLARRLGEASLRRYQERFTLEAMVSKISAIYAGEPVPVLSICGFSDVAGGGQQSLLSLLKNLDRSRFRPILLLPGPGEMSDSAALLNVEVHHESYPSLKSWCLWRPLLFILRLARLIRTSQALIVHSDQPDLSFMSAVAARLAGARSVFHARVSEQYRFDRLLQLLNSVVVAVSQTTARRFSAFGGAQVFVARNGVDLALFAPARKTDDAPVLGYAGQLVREKGLDTIVRAFALVQREIPQAKLVIVGRGPQESEMRQAVEQLGLGSQIMFIGFHPHPHQVIRTFDLLLFPSRYEEGLSRALFEAMACGVPAIASAHGSNPEIVTDGQDGFIIEGDAPELYAEKAILLLRNRDLLGTFSANARKTAEARFDAVRSSQRMARIYEGLLERSPRQTLARQIYFVARRACLMAVRPFLPQRPLPKPASVKRILVLRPDRLGDIVLSLPFFHGLRRAYPQARIALLCQAPWAPLAADFASIDEIIPWTGFSRELLARLRGARFDLAVDAVHDSDLWTAILCRASRARFCLGFESQGRGLLLDRAVSVPGRRHFTQEMTELADALGVEVDPKEALLHLSQHRLDAAWTRLAVFGIKPGDKILFLHPGGHYQAQRWPAERFAQAAMAARRACGCKVIAAAGRMEAAELATIKASHCADAVFLDLEIMDLAALIGVSTLFAGNNSGPLHLSCALDVASVSTMGPSDPARWQPLGKRCRVLKASDFGPGDDVCNIPEAAFTAALCEMFQDS